MVPRPSEQDPDQADYDRDRYAKGDIFGLGRSHVYIDRVNGNIGNGDEACKSSQGYLRKTQRCGQKLERHKRNLPHDDYWPDHASRRVTFRIDDSSAEGFFYQNL